MKNIMGAVWELPKETKGRSSGQTPFTLKPKQLALKKQFLTQKNTSQISLKKIHFCINFLVRTLQCKKILKIKFLPTKT